MPPGYVLYLYLFFNIDNIETRNFFIILSQILFSCLLTYILFHYIEKIFNKQTAFIASIIVAILPEFILSSCSIQTTVFYHLFIISILLLLELQRNNSSWKIFMLLSVLFLFLIYFRSEAILFAGIITIYFFFQKKYVKGLLFISIIILFILPWQFRNYKIFNEFVPFTTSSGLNFYRGHNPYEIGAWGDSTTNAYLYSIRKEPDF